MVKYNLIDECIGIKEVELDEANSKFQTEKDTFVKRNCLFLILITESLNRERRRDGRQIE